MIVLFLFLREAKKQWRCPLCPGNQDWPMLVRHLRGGAHNQTPAQVRALLPPGYKTRPPRPPRAGLPAADEDDLEDEEDPDNPEAATEAETEAETTTEMETTVTEAETTLVSDTVDSEEEDETESMRTVSTRSASENPTPVQSRPPSPVLVRIDSNHVNAIPGRELEEAAARFHRSRSPSLRSTPDSVRAYPWYVPGPLSPPRRIEEEGEEEEAGADEGGEEVANDDPPSVLERNILEVPDSSIAETHGTLPAPSRPGSRLSGEFLKFCLLFS